jgi:hypothetical protein
MKNGKTDERAARVCCGGVLRRPFRAGKNEYGNVIPGRRSPSVGRLRFALAWNATALQAFKQCRAVSVVRSRGGLAEVSESFIPSVESKLGQAARYNHRFAILLFDNSTCARRADPPRALTPASSPAALFGLLLPQPFALGFGHFPIAVVGIIFVVVVRVVVAVGVRRLRGEMGVRRRGRSRVRR